jgi:hypothetical protein
MARDYSIEILVTFDRDTELMPDERRELGDHMVKVLNRTYGDRGVDWIRFHRHSTLTALEIR